jgi:tetratricopeptide (TPR) repeat protein
VKRWAWIVFGLVAALAGPAIAGIIVEMRDPRYFERQHQIIFPQAEVKLVTFEFEASAGDERGKRRAKELHNEFLKKINDLQGGAIITYVTPPGQKIENYRVTAPDVARQQKAQMVLWGRVLADKTGPSLISARLMLVQAPPGISAEYQGSRNVPMKVTGLVEAPVTQLRIDFSTLEDDVTPLAYFLSGLARYYKAAVRDDTTATRWLNSSVADFHAYLQRVDSKTDASAVAQARLYLARAFVRLAAVDAARSRQWLGRAAAEADQSARLNPYDASVPTAQAVIAVRQGASLAEVRAHLIKATTLAPTDGRARVNLGVLEAAQGQLDAARRQLDNAGLVDQSPEVSKAVQNVRGQLERVR